MKLFKLFAAVAVLSMFFACGNAKEEKQDQKQDQKVEQKVDVKALVEKAYAAAENEDYVGAANALVSIPPVAMAKEAAAESEVFYKASEVIIAISMSSMLGDGDSEVVEKLQLWSTNVETEFNKMASAEDEEYYEDEASDLDYEDALDEYGAMVDDAIEEYEAEVEAALEEYEAEVEAAIEEYEAEIEDAMDEYEF